MTGKSKKRSGERAKQEAPETRQRDAASSEKEPSREQPSEPPSEHRYRSQRTDLLEGDPAGTAFSEEMGHTPTRE